MNEIVQLVSQKTGLDEAKAKQAVDTVMDYLRKKLPKPVAAQLDNAVSGDGKGGMVGKAMGGLSGMMGGSKSQK